MTILCTSTRKFYNSISFSTLYNNANNFDQYILFSNSLFEYYFLANVNLLGLKSVRVMREILINLNPIAKNGDYDILSIVQFVLLNVQLRSRTF